MLMYPFAVLIVLFIGAVAVDGAVLFQAHRQAVDVASGLAGDMAGLVDERAFAVDGVVRIDPDRAGEVLAFANEVRLVDDPNELSCTGSVTETTATVTCRGVGRALLSPVAGLAGDLAVEATSTASVVER